MGQRSWAGQAKLYSTGTAIAESTFDWSFIKKDDETHWLWWETAVEVFGGPSGSSGQVSLVLHKEGRRKVPALVLFWGAPIGLHRQGRRNVEMESGLVGAPLLATDWW